MVESGVLETIPEEDANGSSADDGGSADALNVVVDLKEEQPQNSSYATVGGSDPELTSPAVDVRDDLEQSEVVGRSNNDEKQSPSATPLSTDSTSTTTIATSSELIQQRNQNASAELRQTASDAANALSHLPQAVQNYAAIVPYYQSAGDIISQARELFVSYDFPVQVATLGGCTVVLLICRFVLLGIVAWIDLLLYMLGAATLLSCVWQAGHKKVKKATRRKDDNVSSETKDND